MAIVTAANENYFDLVDGLVESLHAARLSSRFQICIFDLGFTPAQRANLESRVRTVVTPGWCIDFPLRATAPTWYRAMVNRPFLPWCFPGYDTYLWLDADTWVQQGDVLPEIVAGAATGNIALVFEAFGPPVTMTIELPDGTVRRGQISEQTVRAALAQCYTICFGPAAAVHAAGPLTNSGVFAIRADSPVWGVWQEYLTRGLRNMRVRHKLVEQQALNLAVIEGAAPVTRLPFRFNWNITTAHPLVDTQRRLLVDPKDVQCPLGIVHLNDLKSIKSLSLRSVDGRSLDVPLGYKQFRQRFA